MRNQASYDDANLILRLYEIRREERLRAARRWFVQNFAPTTVAEYQALCPPGTDANDFARMVVTYYEMIASFITGGVLNPELYFASGGELGMVFTRIEPLLAELRQAFSHPGLYKNLEIVALQYGAWMDAKQPGAWEAFQKRGRGLIIKK